MQPDQEKLEKTKVYAARLVSIPGMEWEENEQWLEEQTELFMEAAYFKVE